MARTVRLDPDWSKPAPPGWLPQPGEEVWIKANPLTNHRSCGQVVSVTPPCWVNVKGKRRVGFKPCVVHVSECRPIETAVKPNRRLRWKRAVVFKAFTEIENILGGTADQLLNSTAQLPPAETFTPNKSEQRLIERLNRQVSDLEKISDS